MPESPPPQTVLERLAAELTTYGRTTLVLSPETCKRYGLQRQLARKFAEELEAKLKTLDVKDGMILFGLERLDIPLSTPPKVS